jgi:hypothetical protein
MRKVAVKTRRPAPATFIGIQDGFGIAPSVELYNLNAPVGIHPIHSSVSRSTLESHGYYVPPIRIEDFAQR